MLPILISLFKLLLIVYAVTCLLLYLLQGSLIFFPHPVPAANRCRWQQYQITVKHDNVYLRGWYIRNNIPKAPLIIYYGGNGEEISVNLDDPHHFQHASMLLINYRGYGASDGYPGERNLFADALFIYDHMVETEKIDPADIILMGRSLGSGVATYVAHKRRVRGVILVTPFDSLENLVKRYLPLFPLGIILRHKFNSVALAPQISHPLLMLTAQYDNIIPAARSRNLARHWQGPVRSVQIMGTDHNDIHLSRRYWQEINRFILKN